MDSISIVMFALAFLIAFVFSIIGLYEFKQSLKDKESPIIGFICNLIAAISWFVFGIFWPASATTEMFTGYGYLFYAFGWIFALIAFFNVFQIAKQSLKRPARGGLEIREANY